MKLEGLIDKLLEIKKSCADDTPVDVRNEAGDWTCLEDDFVRLCTYAHTDIQYIHIGPRAND